MDELRNFVTAQYLQSHWKIFPAELLNFIHSGLPAYRQTGIAIEAEELLPEKTLFDITKGLLLRAVRNSEAEKCRRFITLTNIPSSFNHRDFKGPIKIAPTNNSAPTGTVSEIDAEAKRVFEKLKRQKDNQTISDIYTFLFKCNEINQFAQLHELKLIDEALAPQEITTTTQPPTNVEPSVPQINNHDTFIRSLRVSYVSDTEISIRVGNKKAENFTREDMGFEKKSALWQPFIKILQTADHKYHVGVHSKDKDPIKNKNYNNLIKQLSNFSKQFVSFLNDKYFLLLPENFNVFENMKGFDRAGTYRPKFQVIDYGTATQSTDIRIMSMTETMNNISVLSQILKSKKDKSKKDQLLGEIGVYAAHAKKMGWITEEQLRNMILSPDEDPSGEDAMSLVQQVEDINKL